MKQFVCGLVVTVLCLLGSGPGTAALFAQEDPGRGRSSPLKREGKRSGESFEEKLLRTQIESHVNRIARWDRKSRQVILRKRGDFGGSEPFLEMLLNRAFQPDKRGLLKLDRKIPLAPVVKIIKRFLAEGGLEKVEKLRRAFKDLKEHPDRDPTRHFEDFLKPVPGPRSSQRPRSKSGSGGARQLPGERRLGEHYGIITPEREKGKRDIWVRRDRPPQASCPHCQKMDRVYRFIRSAVHNLLHERWLRQKEGQRKKIIIRRREHREEKLRPGKRSKPRMRIEIQPKKEVKPRVRIELRKRARPERRVQPGRHRKGVKKERKLY